MEQSIVEYDEFKAKMAQVAKIADFEPDTSTEEGYEKSKRIALDIRKVVGNLERTRKDLKAESLEYGRRVDGQAKVIKEELDKMREPHQLAYQAVDEEKKQREARRLADMERRIADIRAIPGNMMGHDSATLNECLEDLRANQCEGFYDMTEQALTARNQSVEKLEEMFSAALANERRAEELAELKAQQEKDAAARAVEEEKARVLQAKADAEAAERQAEADAKAAEQQKVIDDLMAEKRKREEAEAEEAKQKQAALAQMAAEKEAAGRAEFERIEAEKAEQLALMESKEHAEKLEREFKKARTEALNAMIDADCGVDMEKLLNEIIAGNIPHITFWVEE